MFFQYDVLKNLDECFSLSDQGPGGGEHVWAAQSDSARQPLGVWLRGPPPAGLAGQRQPAHGGHAPVPRPAQARWPEVRGHSSEQVRLRPGAAARSQICGGQYWWVGPARASHPKSIQIVYLMSSESTYLPTYILSNSWGSGSRK